jgi:uridine phosphorylase
MYVASPGVGVVPISGPGAPFAAIVVEELAALGVEQFVIVGLAGSLQPDLRAGSFVLCNRALRDEGTSHHYAAPSDFARPSRRLTQLLAQALRREAVAHRTGPSWTIDTPYRETVPEIRRYRAEGILTVEMEASAVFTVARHLGREAAALFVVSDVLHENGWEPSFHDAWGPLTEALEVTLRALSRPPR